MNDSTKLWKWMVALLAILNVTLLIALFNGRKHMEQMHHEIRMNAHGGKPSDLLVEELKLTPEQVKDFEVLKGEHRERIKNLMKEGHELRDSFFALLKTNAVDEKAMTVKAEEIARNQQNIEMATFNHFRNVRAICTQEQKKHFDEIIDEVLRTMAGPPGGPHGPPHGPPPPHHP